jgi:hypothetical protein
VYLSKQKQQNIEGAIAWLQMKLDQNPEFFNIDRDGAIMIKEFLVVLLQ